jgi:hypothetical protein
MSLPAPSFNIDSLFQNNSSPLCCSLSLCNSLCCFSFFLKFCVALYNAFCVIFYVASTKLFFLWIFFYNYVSSCFSCFKNYLCKVGLYKFLCVSLQFFGLEDHFYKVTIFVKLFVQLCVSTFFMPQRLPLQSFFLFENLYVHYVYPHSWSLNKEFWVLWNLCFIFYFWFLWIF